MVLLAVLDYGLGNLRSICRGLEKVGARVRVTAERSIIRRSDAIVLPGVGAFRDAIEKMLPIKDEVLKSLSEGKPLLGVCLGLQLLFTESTEGGLYKGLNILKGEVQRLPPTVKIPHMGWNSIEIVREDPIVEGIISGSYAYFVHSYFSNPVNKDITVAETVYGVTFPSIVSKAPVYATQFHPEKSGKTGLQILKSFVNIVRR